MKAEENPLKSLDVMAALEYIEKAKKAGRSEDEAFSDYLVSRGFRSSEEYEAFLQKSREETRQSFERITSYLEQMRRIVHTAQKKYAGV